MGKTQNANESLHSVVWHNFPKGKYVGQKSLYCSSALAVTSFNEGSLCFAAILNEYGIPSSASTLYHLDRRDKTRIYMRERAIIQTQRRRRHQLKVRSHTAETSRQRREKSASKYSSGKFGTELVPIATSSVSKEPNSGDESDTTCSKCEQRNCPIGRRKKVQDDWVRPLRSMVSRQLRRCEEGLRPFRYSLLLRRLRGLLIVFLCTEVESMFVIYCTTS